MRMVTMFMVSFLFLISACQGQERSPIDVTMYNPAGDSIGTATLNEQADGVQVTLSVEGLEPGLHGIHVHEYPECEGPDFKSAGSHYNPEGNEHGLMHPEGSHLGDLPNIEVSEDGMVDEAELQINGATLTDGNTSILKEDGTSLIIHQKQDDGVSQPAGNAGERIACGVISLDEADQEAPTDPTETDEDTEE
ncbi:superoxide dismutase family protein [Aquibacillus sediminis]|uniref:superoxide dismutase family protein n=1 Tax=Aquibacillus sediminis TaxID=2574734 RepID=UPI00110876FF|nr:superoxide dismutase family protein [Aquibacillus sediminis]